MIYLFIKIHIIVCGILDLPNYSTIEYLGGRVEVSGYMNDEHPPRGTRKEE